MQVQRLRNIVEQECREIRKTEVGSCSDSMSLPLLTVFMGQAIAV